MVYQFFLYPVSAHIGKRHITEKSLKKSEEGKGLQYPHSVPSMRGAGATSVQQHLFQSAALVKTTLTPLSPFPTIERSRNVPGVGPF